MAITSDRLAELEEEKDGGPVYAAEPGIFKFFPSDRIAEIQEEFSNLEPKQQQRFLDDRRDYYTPDEFEVEDYPVHSGGAFHWNYNPDVKLDPEDPVSQQQIETEFGLLLNTIPKPSQEQLDLGINPLIELLNSKSLSPIGETMVNELGFYHNKHNQFPRNFSDFREDIVTIDAAEGEPLTTDRVAEIQDEENLQDEENWGTKTAEFLMGMLPSEEKSMGENLFDIATLAVPPAKALKLGKLADPILDTGIMQMAGKGRTYGGGFSKPGVTKIRGGGKQNTLKTRSPEVWNVYTDIARFSDGGSKPGKLTPQQVEQLRAIMPKLRAAASSQVRHGRTTMNNVVRMFDENFK